jgi:guanylate kinase
VKRREEHAVTIFVTAPVEELERRLRGRATESSGAIDERIETAKQQLQLQGAFDFVVENDERERAATALAAIVAQELDRAATMAAQ